MKWIFFQFLEQLTRIFHWGHYVNSWIKIIFVGKLFSFCAFSFHILLFSSLIFYSAAKALPPRTDVVNISTLFISLKFIVDLQPHKFISFFFLSSRRIRLFFIQSVFLNTLDTHILWAVEINSNQNMSRRCCAWT